MEIPHSQQFFAAYTAKDLILYALSIGYGDEDLKFVFEHDPDFQAVPTFPFVLAFWAHQQQMDHGRSSNDRMQPFPPNMMQEVGLIPDICRKTSCLFEGPVLHTWQSIRWHQEVPVPQISELHRTEYDAPATTTITSRPLSVTPKPIGTFVTSETRIALAATGQPLCTLIATSLMLGMPEDDIIALSGSSPKRISPFISSSAPTFVWRYTTHSAQALLYRLGSGDSNKIHVDSSAALLLDINTSKPILHGLCTLGIATRAILQCLGQNTKLIYLEGQFTFPVFVGDALVVSLWDNPEKQSMHFKVTTEGSEKVILDNGYLEYDHAHRLTSRL